MRIAFLIALVTTICFPVFSQDETTIENQTKPYVVVTIEGKAFTKKLKVEVDFGELPEQIKSGKEYSEILTNKKSYAAILNYMAEKQFELVETRDYTFTYAGSGGTAGIIFIFRRKK